jgi:hypothetical protein
MGCTASNNVQALYIIAYILPGSFFSIQGGVSLSAYSNRETRKAVYSANVTFKEVVPVTVSLPNQHAAAPVLIDVELIPNNRPCKFLLKTLVLQRWEERLVNKTRGNKQDLAKNVMSLYNELMAAGVFPGDSPCPVLQDQQQHVVSSSSSLRPSTQYTSESFEVNPAGAFLSGEEIVKHLKAHEEHQQQQQQQKGPRATPLLESPASHNIYTC